jgi:hypothetical protein
MAELLRLAGRIVEDGRAPTAEERRRFEQLKIELQATEHPWRDRLTELTDRLAALLEGMGI